MLQKSSAKYLALGTALAVPALLLACLAWVFSTSAGAQWLFRQLPSTVEGLEVAAVRGTLADELVLAGIEYSNDSLSVSVKELNLRWQPLQMLGMTVSVEALFVDGVAVELHETDDTKEPSSPFSVDDLQLPVDVLLSKLQLSNLSVLNGEAEQHIDSIALALQWSDSLIRLDSLSVESPDIALNGQLEAGLKPEMPLAGSVTWRAPLAELGESRGELTLSGSTELLTLKLLADGALPLQLEGQTQQLFTDPGWDLVLTVPELSLIAAGSPVVIAGELRSQGKLTGYAVDAEGTADLLDLAPLQFSLSAQGDDTTLVLGLLRIETAPYALAARGNVSWQDAIVVAIEHSIEVNDTSTLSEALPPQLSGEGRLNLQLRDEVLSLSEITLALAASPLTLSASGEVQLAGPAPDMDLQLDWQSITWPLDAASPDVNSTGQARITGSPDAWALTLNADVAGDSVPASEWQGALRGNASEASIDSLQGQLLSGTLELNGTVAFADKTRWDVLLQGQGIDPAELAPDWPGRLAFSARSAGQLVDDGPVGSVVLESVSGTLADAPLEAVASIALAGERTVIESLNASLGGNQVALRGLVQGNDIDIDLEGRLGQLGLFSEGADGLLQLSGSVAGTIEKPSIAARATGDDILLAGQPLQSLSIDVQGSLDASAPLRVNVDAVGDQGNPESSFSTLSLKVNGTTRAHELTLSADALGDHVKATLTGGLGDDSQWQGELEQLRVRAPAPVGAWALQSAAALHLSAESAELQRACLRPARGVRGELCLAAEWVSDGDANLTLGITELQLRRLLADLTGTVSGSAQAMLSPQGDLVAEAEFTATEGTVRFDTGDGFAAVDHGGGKLTAEVAENGLSAKLVSKPLAAGQINAQVVVPALNSLPVADALPLTGTIDIDLPDLSGLQAWVPDLEAVAGALEARLALSGSVDAPQIGGRAALTGGAAQVPTAGLVFSDASLILDEIPSQANVMKLNGAVSSGPGKLLLDGTVDLGALSADVSVQGDRFEVYNTRDAVARIAPDLSLQYAGDQLRVRGRVDVNRADITPQLSLRAGSGTDTADDAEQRVYLTPSPDVVIVGSEAETLNAVADALPFDLDSEVILDLGDSVAIDALGFVGNVTGAVTFINPPGRREPVPLANGRLAVEKGTFKAFSQDLEIQTGQLVFRNDLATEPELNLRAVRWIDNDPLVSAAGVQVTGSLEEPVLELFSTPQLSQAEIQSYLLTGSSASDRDTTALSIGTYIRPKLYVGYGYNVLEETSEFNALYTINPRYGAQISVGEADNNVGLTFTHEN